MNNCGSSAWLVPTNVELDTRDLEVRDLSATNISCSNLSVNGNPISDVFENVTASAGLTAFTGDVTADNVYVTDEVSAPNMTCSFLTTGVITSSSLTATGGITSSATVSGATLASSGNITQNAGTAALKAVTATSISNTGTLTQSGAATLTSTLNVSGTLTCANITQSSGTATLNTVTASSVNCTGGFTAGSFNPINISNSGTLTQTGAATFSTNITQSAGTAALKAVTADSVSNTGTLTQTGAATFATNITQTSGTSSLKAVSATQVIQSVPSFAFYKIQGFQSVTTSAEVSVKFTSQASSTDVINQGTSNPSYDSTTGTFTNSSSFARVFLVSYTLFWQGATGGRRMCYIRTANTSGNYPKGFVGVGGNGQEASSNTAMSYILGGDSNTITMTGCAPILVAANSTFSVYAYQSQGGTLTLAGHVSITVL